MIEALFIEAQGGMQSPTDIREHIEEALEKIAPDPETWGTSPRAVRGMAAAESMFGPAGGAS